MSYSCRNVVERIIVSHRKRRKGSIETVNENSRCSFRSIDNQQQEEREAKIRYALAVAVPAVLFSFDLGSVVLRQFFQSRLGSTGQCHGGVRFRSRNSLIFTAGDAYCGS